MSFLVWEKEKEVRVVFVVTDIALRIRDKEGAVVK